MADLGPAPAGSERLPRGGARPWFVRWAEPPLTRRAPTRRLALLASLAAWLVVGLVAPGAARGAAPGRQEQTAGCEPGVAPATPLVATGGNALGERLSWATLAGIPRPRSELGAAVVGGRIYVVGGFGGTAQVDCFDPTSGTWAAVADLPAGVHHPGVAALDGFVYVAGGYTDAGGATDALWAYDPATDVWEPRAPMPTARGALGLAALDGRLYAVGGARERLGGPVTGAVEAYDPAADVWQARASMLTPREHLAVAAGSGRVFAAGGRANGDEGAALAGAAEGYDPVADRWGALPPLPTPRGGVAGVFAAGRLVVLGGERGPDAYAAAEAYDPATGTWTMLPPLPTARHGLAGAAVDATVYAITGSTRAGAAENTPATEALTLNAP